MPLHVKSDAYIRPLYTNPVTDFFLSVNYTVMCITTNSRVSGYEGPDKVLRLCDNKNSCIPISWLS